ncbi:MarR family winged helix-turn-helix transcriptional regulator [Arvimicrobium flavum]|uniref:MarR family winged helix-turn-helix transcriptional regulator n=1 Tax=Arvimicrobium flavum TaxID=3393320 RepID=UPI00237BB321|nr:MarR family winged helix-turn-helix transcriptional regulator [Mesorhizobium shangrilense]
MTDENLLDFSTTLEVRDSCLCMHAQRAARALARRYDEALRPSGLTNGQFSVLMALNRPGGAGIRDVAEVLAMDRTTVTAVLKPLTRRGLVEVAASPKDRRARALILTQAGRGLLVAALPVWRKMQKEIESLLQEPERLRTEMRSLC